MAVSPAFDLRLESLIWRTKWRTIQAKADSNLVSYSEMHKSAEQPDPKMNFLGDARRRSVPHQLTPRYEAGIGC